MARQPIPWWRISSVPPAGGTPPIGRAIMCAAYEWRLRPGTAACFLLSATAFEESIA